MGSAQGSHFSSSNDQSAMSLLNLLVLKPRMIFKQKLSNNSTETQSKIVLFSYKVILPVTSCVRYSLYFICIVYM